MRWLLDNSSVRIGRIVAGLLGLCLVLMPLASCGTTEALKSVPLDLGIPAEALNSKVTGSVPDNTVLHARITFKIDPKLMQKAQNQKIEPGKPSHLENLANQIGIDDATYQKFKDFFNPQGITLKLSKMRTHLSIDAKASTFAKVLNTKFVNHNYHGRTFYAPDAKKPAMVPQFLVGSIEAVTGLDNYSTQPVHQASFQPAVPAQSKKPAADCSPPDQTLLPKDIAHAYGVDQLWNQGLHGENMTINLVEIDGSMRSDVQNYLDCISFKGKVTSINVDGHPQDTLGESTLDIQMAAGLARSANIKVYQTDGTSNNSSDIWVNVNDELQQILNDNVNNANAGSTVSISLGAAEEEMSQSDLRALDQSIQQLTKVEHMTVFVASGDCGAFGSHSYGNLAVSFPASDPWSVAVGGTILQVDGGQSRANETSWSDGSNHSSCKNRWGTGGGLSKVFSMPSWQNQSGVKNNQSNGKRQIPDVSAAAYGLAVYYQGQWGSVGGTSAAAPIWATALALVNQGLLKQGKAFNYSPQMFYDVAKKNNRAYYDVTQGDNLYYRAAQGWDYTTGLGTPNLRDFYAVAGR
ncbi:pseudomonapepsin [Dictyobacter vulcani]|uniref:Pseudomonapepsin n=1 Tax=Dictyobacter vulcani TaxID=2607529 RepID=A0A5J4KJS4_9CHLR|nr:S53 family peptidase [Dictyobacter vulcani]GER86610.1 pseudomonapepsin [Dictyobacter vulcani]